jgi:CelD/BcsL family acetyltransferase involved in cellulose biosynthesis
LGEIRFEFDCAEPGAELNRCIETKRQQYSRTDVRDPLDSVAARSLLTNLVNTESSRCRGIVSTLYAGEHWLATHMGMINEDVMHYWFPVYNPELVDYSPGRILIVKMIEHAQHLGTRSFDFGAGESQMKRKFSNTHRMVLKGEARIRHINTMIYKVSLSSKWYFNAFRRKLFS